jgi:hypothetical protein
MESLNAKALSAQNKPNKAKLNPTTCWQDPIGDYSLNGFHK